MLILYRDATSQEELGRLKQTDIPSALLPDLREGDNKVFTHQEFSGTLSTNWQVMDITSSPHQITIDLLPSPKPNSNFGHYATAVRNQKRPSHFLKKWTVVGVDFSHHSKLHKLGQNAQLNRGNPAASLPGELHKLRPCVLIHKSDNSAQLIPLSTKDQNAHINSSIEISPLSFNRLSQFFRKKTSYALLDMICTVSCYRIHPLDDEHGRPLEHNKQQELCQSDIIALESNLLKFHSPKMTGILNSSALQLASKDKEIKKLKEKNTKNRENYLSNQEKLQQQEKIIRLIGQEVFDLKHEDLIELMAEIETSL